jgi:SAM-dependent methyltransferase
MSSSQRQAVFRPEVYEVNTLEQAMAVTVTPEQGTTTEERWKKETDFLVEDIGRQLELGPEDCVLDYGCGAGRLAKAMIDGYGCRVIGVDSSKSMRLLSPDYVLSDRFTVWSPQLLGKMTEKGFRFSKGICLWVLQHVFSPEDTIGLIANAYIPGTKFYVLNQDGRCIPTNLGYVNDGKDIRAELVKQFRELERRRLPQEVTTPNIAQHTNLFVLERLGN